MGKWTLRFLPFVAVGMLASGAYLGLVWAPPERMMGNVQRIMYVHVPSVWMALLGVLLNFVTSIYFLLRGSPRADALAEAGAEVGLLFGCIGVSLGAIWARPTWGVWWTWDPRLTSAAVMLLAYAAYLALRRWVDDPDKRAAWSAVVAIVNAVDIPVVYFSVRWWRSLHQIQSTPATVAAPMKLALRWNAFAFLAVFLLFIVHRYRLAVARRAEETAVPPLPAPEAVVS
jgi:heme exporter protein C